MLFSESLYRMKQQQTKQTEITQMDSRTHQAQRFQRPLDIGNNTHDMVPSKTSLYNRFQGNRCIWGFAFECQSNIRRTRLCRRRNTLCSVLSNHIVMSNKTIPSELMSCIDTLSLDAAFLACPKGYGHFVRSAFMEGFLRSDRFVSLVVLNKTVVAYQGQGADLLSSCNLWQYASVMCMQQGEVHAGTFVRLLAVIPYIGCCL